jgi:hypothetical protein
VVTPETANLRLALVYKQQGKTKEAADLLFSIVDAARKAKDPRVIRRRNPRLCDAAQELQKVDPDRYAQLPPRLHEPAILDLSILQLPIRPCDAESTMTHGQPDSLTGWIDDFKAGLASIRRHFDPLYFGSQRPDADLISGIFGDRWTLLHYHRGITHSILGTLLLSLIIPSLFWLGDLILSTWRQRARTLRFRGLLLASLIVSATHPLMDWTNNYGVDRSCPERKMVLRRFGFHSRSFLW